jgi:hypothetical protein
MLSQVSCQSLSEPTENYMFEILLAKGFSGPQQFLMLRVQVERCEKASACLDAPQLSNFN